MFFKKYFLFFSVLLVFLLSCTTQNSNQTIALQTLSRENRTTLNSLKNNLIEESLSYAERQLKVFSISEEDLLKPSYPILKNKNEIPLFDRRIEGFTKNLTSILENSINDVSREMKTTLKRYNVSNSNFNYFYEESLSFTEEAIKALDKSIDETIAKTLDIKFKETDIYEEWNTLFETYNFWKLHFDNISSITGVNTYEEQQPISLLNVCTLYIKNAFILNARVGERIAKETQIDGWKNTINMLYY